MGHAVEDLGETRERHGDYQRVAAAIELIAARREEQPTLGALSRELGISEHHLQRVFSRWAGISPKRFLQYLTKEHAKALLLETNVLDAALAAGLSGTSRLHDLMVSCDAITPGELRTAGAGLGVRYGIHETPFGGCLLATTARGICKLAFFDTYDERRALEGELRAEWSNGCIARDDVGTASTAARLFSIDWRGKRPLHVLLKGTNFQLKVWEALLRIPHGGLADYGTVAEMVDAPSAARAVGNAIARNEIAYLIPCHRVIRSTGDFSHYRWGATRKRALIGWESAAKWHG